ncbi:MAG: pyridoxine 5'-phosphate synthase [Cytophagales bacterium]|nr:pyridoxine 5'-phosphate synthase [Cytophagales bacterium]
MTKLSVNVNKFATLRNARGGNNPNLVNVAKDCEAFGAQGITVHPRPDERHITYQDVMDLQQVVTTEFNIEGYPDKRYLQIIEKVRPVQATLVPDEPDVLTSNAGWDTVRNASLLKEIVSELKKLDVRVSLFVDPAIRQVEGAVAAGADRIELYTEPYAANFAGCKEAAVAPYVKAAGKARELGIAVNAGHDLDLYNLYFLKKQIPFLAEVSIGHALVCDALYYGLENTIQMYLRELNK